MKVAKISRRNPDSYSRPGPAVLIFQMAISKETKTMGANDWSRCLSQQTGCFKIHREKSTRIDFSSSDIGPHDHRRSIRKAVNGGHPSPSTRKELHA